MIFIRVLSCQNAFYLAFIKGQNRKGHVRSFFHDLPFIYRFSMFMTVYIRESIRLVGRLIGWFRNRLLLFIIPHIVAGYIEIKDVIQ